MLGHAVFRLFAASADYRVVGTVRSPAGRQVLPQALQEHVLTGVNAEDTDSLVSALATVHPDVVVNAVGVVKQLDEAAHPLTTVPINALLPHRLVQLCALVGARLVHVSTDCVFAGTRGNYRESDPADALDLYGRSKHMGEVDAPHAITLRTSIIGHELRTAHGLIEWFLSQGGPVRGFRRAIFSGLPTVELARVIKDVVLPRPELRGVYHVASTAIDKDALLRMVAEVYGHRVAIAPDDTLVIDRSLNADRFHAATGYTAGRWPELIAAMKAFG
jgi:dTDP-4-dehydrorhamnose reductase